MRVRWHRSPDRSRDATPPDAAQRPVRRVPGAGHRYAGVPCYNLRRLSRAVAADPPRPRTLLGAWREMRATWKRQQVEPGYQYDTPVPAPGRVAAPAARDDDELGASIGDLAPGILARAGV